MVIISCRWQGLAVRRVCCQEPCIVSPTCWPWRTTTDDSCATSSLVSSSSSSSSIISYLALLCLKTKEVAIDSFIVFCIVWNLYFLQHGSMYFFSFQEGGVLLRGEGCVLTALNLAWVCQSCRGEVWMTGRHEQKQRVSVGQEWRWREEKECPRLEKNRETPAEIIFAEAWHFSFSFCSRLHQYALFLLQLSTAVQVGSAVLLMLQNQPFSGGPLPSPTVWSPGQSALCRHVCWCLSNYFGHDWST